MIAEHMAQCLATLKPRQEDPGPRPMGFGVGLSAVGCRPQALLQTWLHGAWPPGFLPQQPHMGNGPRSDAPCHRLSVA